MSRKCLDTFGHVRSNSEASVAAVTECLASIAILQLDFLRGLTISGVLAYERGHGEYQ